MISGNAATLPEDSDHNLKQELRNDKGKADWKGNREDTCKLTV